MKKILIKLDNLFYLITTGGIFNRLLNGGKTKKLIKKQMYNRTLTEEEMLSKIFKYRVGYNLNLNNPKTYNEKLNWLKLNWRYKNIKSYTDKIEFKNTLYSLGLSDNVSQTIGIYNKVEEIRFNKLPSEFVIKTTHDSGGVWIVSDKNRHLIKSILKEVEKNMMKENQTVLKNEWVYEDIKPRIIIEEKITSKDKDKAIDYKIYCFHGEPKYISVIKGRGSFLRINYYDINWNRIRMKQGGQGSFRNDKKPEKLDEMIEISKKLSGDFPHVRVDLYYERNHVYIGEMTFFDSSGFEPFYPRKYDYIFGDNIDLSKITNKNC